MSDIDWEESRKIKIIFLIGGLGLGGSERQLFLVLKNLDKSQFDCHVVVFNSYQDYFAKYLSEMGVAVWNVPNTCKGISTRIYFLYQLFRKIRPHIVHSWIFHDNPYAGLVGFIARVPVRLGSQRNEFTSKNVQGLPSIYKFLSLYSISKIIVNSNVAFQEMKKTGYPVSRLIYVSNIVDHSPSKANDDSLHALAGIPRNIPIIGNVGNLRQQKNHLMFVEMMASVCEDFQDVRGVIIGQVVNDEPEILAKIENRINDFSLDDRLVFLGYRKDVPVLMNDISILCLTSDYEGTPNVILEAMAASKPVVATRVGGVPDLVRDGVNGYLVESGDVTGFSNAVLRLLRNPDLANKMGKAGGEIAEREFGCEQAARRLTGLYIDALTQKGINVTG